MRKIITTLVMGILLFTVAACGGPHEERVLEEDLETLLEDIHNYEELDEETQSFLEGLSVEEVSDDRTAFHLGTEAYDYDRAIANVPELSMTPFELTLVRVSAGENIDVMVNGIKENIDPMKWGSIGVDPESIMVDNIGDVIVIIMSDEHMDALHEAFLALEDMYVEE